MDAFCQNAGAPGTLPEEPGPNHYDATKMLTASRKFANPSPVRYTKPRPNKPFGNGVPGPASYEFPDGLGKQPLSQYKSPTSIKMTASKRKSMFDVDSDVPGPNAYGMLSLPSHGGGVQFGPLGGHTEFNAPRPMRPSQQAAVEANKRRPGPGAYNILSSVGKQVESSKPSPAQVSFGSSTRKQRTKMYMGHGVTTVEATLGEGAGFKYCHPELPFSLRPHSPSTHFGRNVVLGDRRLARVRQRREELEAQLQNIKTERQQSQASTPKHNDTIETYNWLRPESVFGRSRGASRATTAPTYDGHSLPRSRPFRRFGSAKFGTDRKFNEKMHMPHSPSTAVGLTAPGPKYNLPPLPQSPGAFFPHYTKRTVEIWQDRVKFENIPGPAAYSTSIEQRMDEVTHQRDRTKEDISELQYQLRERNALVQDSKNILEDAETALEKMEMAKNEDEKLKHEIKRKIANNAPEPGKSKKTTKPQAESTEITLEDVETREQKRERAIKLQNRNMKLAKDEHLACLGEYNNIKAMLTRLQRRFNRLNHPPEDVVSMKYGPDPRVSTPGTVCMASGTRDQARKMHQPNMKVNPDATRDVPGPASYDITGKTFVTSGGRFSTAFPMDDVEWVMLRASKLPGPNEYSPVSVMGKVPVSTIQSAPSLVFATAGRDARKKWYFPGAPSDSLGMESPGPAFQGRSSVGPQVLSTYPNSTVCKFFTGKPANQLGVDQVPGPGAYRPPHQVYSSAVKRLRKKSPLDYDRPIVKASRFGKTV